MANASILAAFERMWQHVISALSNKSDISHDHNDIYYTETEVDDKISAVNTSVSEEINEKVALLATTEYVDSLFGSYINDIDTLVGGDS